MKKLFLGVFLSFSIATFGQSLEDLIHSKYEAKPESAEGHPYLFEEYVPGSLKVISGNKENALIRYNLADNNLVATFHGVEYILKKDKIEAFTISKLGDRNYNFIPLNIGAKQYFVELIFEGQSVKYVKWHRKIFKLAQPVSGSAGYDTGGSNDRFEEVLSPLLLINGLTLEFPEKKDELLNMLAGDNAELKTHLTTTMKQKKLKIKNEEDVVALLQAREEYLKK